MPRSGGDPALVVFTRAPIAGRVKTRLCQGTPALTAEQAARLQVALCSDVCANGARSGIARRRLYVDGELSHPELLSIAATHGFELVAQQGVDLGGRMAAAISDELAAGASAVVVIGTDSPTLPCAYLRRAAELLHGPAAVVLGPAADGGYYLVGARQEVTELFSAGVAWGTDQVLPETLLRLEQLRRRGVPVALLPFYYDVDTPQDLRLLACHLRLADPGAFAARRAAPDGESLVDVSAPATAALLRELGWL